MDRVRLRRKKTYCGEEKSGSRHLSRRMFSYLSLPLFFSHATSPPCSHPTSYNQPSSTPSPIIFPFLLPCKLPSSHLPITFLFFLSLFPTWTTPTNQLPKHAPHLLTMLSIHLCWQPLEDPSLGSIKSHGEEEKGWPRGGEKEQKEANFFRDCWEWGSRKKGAEFYFFSREKGKVLSFLSKKEKGRELLAIVGQPMTLFFFFWFASFLLVPSWPKVVYLL